MEVYSIVKLFGKRHELRPRRAMTSRGHLLLALFATLLSGTPMAFAAAPVISTSTTITNGALDPVILINGSNFFTDLNKFNFTVDAGSTELSFDTAAFINPTSVRLTLRGTAQAGSITVQASVSAFYPVADTQSNTLTITVPKPLIAQSITFDSLKPMTVTDSNQILSASSTSGLDVSFLGITPYICRIVSQKIQPVTAGTCSIVAYQNGNSSYQAAPNIIQSFMISAADSGVVDKPDIDPPKVNTIGTLEYSPSTPTTTDKDFTFFSSGDGQNGTMTVKLQVPSQTTKNPVVFLVSSYSSDSENNRGFFVVDIEIVDKNGFAINHLEKAYKITMPRGYFYSEIFWSSDSLTWQRITEIKNETLPDDEHSVFFREVNGSVSILTDQHGLFGYRYPQEDLKVLSRVKTLAIGGQTQLDCSGGSGTGEVTYGTTTATVCAVTTDGIVSAKQAGKCLVFARKYAAQHFIDTVSGNTTIIVGKSEATGKGQDGLPRPKTPCDTLSYSLSQSATKVEAIFCPKNAGQVATLYVRVETSANKWVNKKVATVIIDSKGVAVFKVTRKIGTSKFLHVFIDGKHGI